MSLRRLVPLLAATCVASPLTAQSDPTLSAVPDTQADQQTLQDQELQKKIDAITAKYKPQIDENTKTIDENKDDKDPIIVKGDCWWDMTSARLDIPQTTFKVRKFSYDVPKTTFKNRDFSFNYPKCDWENVRVGPIVTKFLKCSTATKHWSTKTPEFKMSRTEFSTKIPEFKMASKEIKFHTLKCKADEIYVGPSKPSDDTMGKINQASANIEAAANAQQKEINAVVEQDLDARSEAFAAQLKEVEQQFDVAIAEIDKSIYDVKSNGMNPDTVMVEIDGKQLSLTAMRAQLVAQKTQTLTEMTDGWQQAVNGVKAGLSDLT